MLELTPKLDIQSVEPLYLQLYNYIREEIESGTLLPHAKLPSKRKFAQHLKISQNTIETAYDQLVAEGYIDALPRKGYFVSELDHQRLDKSITRKIPYVEEKPYRDQGYSFDFTQTGVDARSFPFERYRNLLNKVIRSNNEEVLMLGHPQGEFKLRQEITNYIYESRGVQCSPSQIVIGAGTHYLIQLLFQLLPISTFAVENPGYHRTLVQSKKGQENVEMIPLEEDGMNVSLLKESKANIVFVTPSHQFPCGMTMPISKRMQLLNWAESKDGRYIIEDDYDSEFRYSSKPIPALQGLDHNEKVIYMSTFSKAFLPSLRISYMVLPEPLIKKYQKDFFFYTQTVSRLGQETLIRFMQEGFWEKHIHKMRVIYHKKRDVLVSVSSTHFPNTIEIIGQDSGLHILIRTNNGMTEQELIDEASKYRIKVYPVSGYGQSDNKTVLLGFAVLTEEEIKEAVRLLAKAWFPKE
ncbi:PLP-dependent aminotransferase family protein [Pseudalkalibacillus decolorationis]|uniref:MocR-like pyridoxine biosynthesis transcription factor PdxR n=1 Tax=Pseudalkalibacillus decolorationis TaxID=163879 RepID=UPI00214813C0|nr:PLP-dependent aminotransferase family protein [Pseudalkalibacillus decolorationis]